MFRNLRTVTVMSQRTIKNFGHKREPVPIITTMWHGFLTFTFIGLVLEWEKIGKFIFGETSENILEDSTESKEKI